MRAFSWFVPFRLIGPQHLSLSLEVIHSVVPRRRATDNSHKISRETRSLRSHKMLLNDDYRRHPYTINLESAIVIDTGLDDSRGRREDTQTGESFFLASDTRINASHIGPLTRAVPYIISIYVP